MRLKDDLNTTITTIKIQSKEKSRARETTHKMITITTITST